MSFNLSRCENKLTPLVDMQGEKTQIAKQEIGQHLRSLSNPSLVSSHTGTNMHEMSAEEPQHEAQTTLIAPESTVVTGS